MARPNLLFIFTDEQRADTMAAYGNPRIHTPNLDRLAQTSTVFERAYVTQPVCTPSRSTIMTGLWPHTNGCTENNIALRDETPTIAEMVSSGDYVKGYHGKWHLGDEIFRQHGFDEWVSVEDMYAGHYAEGRDRTARSSYHHWLVAKGKQPSEGNVFYRDQTAHYDEEYSKPVFQAEEATRFIQENRGRPWMLYVNYLEPHMPFFGPRDNQYALDDVALPGNFRNELRENQPMKARLLARNYYEKGHSGLPLRTEADWRRMIANYWGLCSQVDASVGRILRTLEQTGQFDNTIIVFTSDHGDMMGSHRLLAKCVMFEEAVRVPLLIKMPKQSAGRRVSGPISQIDLVPTLLDCMEQDVPGILQGRSRRGVLESPDATNIEDDAFIEWNGGNNGLRDVMGKADVPDWMTAYGAREHIERAMTDPVRTVITADGWKLNWSPELGEHELYNLTQDPGETRNVFAEQAGSTLVSELKGRIARWQEGTGDRVEL